MFLLAAQEPVGVLLIIVGHQHPSDPGGAAQGQALLPGGVPPAGTQVRWGKVGVPDQQIAPAGKVRQRGECLFIRFAVQRVGQTFTLPRQAVEKTSARVVPRQGGDRQPGQVKSIPWPQLVEHRAGREFLQLQRPEGGGDQGGQILFQPRAAVEMELQVRAEQRREGVQSQHMVNVEVAEQDVNPGHVGPARQSLPQRGEPRPGVQNGHLSSPLQRDADGIPAVFHKVRLRPGGGAPDAPDRDLPCLFHPKALLQIGL